MVVVDGIPVVYGLRSGTRAGGVRVDPTQCPPRRFCRDERAFGIWENGRTIDRTGCGARLWETGSVWLRREKRENDRGKNESEEVTGNGGPRQLR